MPVAIWVKLGQFTDSLDCHRLGAVLLDLFDVRLTMRVLLDQHWLRHVALHNLLYIRRRQSHVSLVCLTEKLDVNSTYVLIL